MAGGGKGKDAGDIDVEVDAETASSMTLDLLGFDDINVEVGGTERPLRSVMEVGGTGQPLNTRTEVILPQPMKTEMRTELAITEPIVTEMTTDARIDVEPVVVDLCVTLGIRDLPRQCIRRPYRRHLGLTFFGMQIVGLDWSGESSIVIDDLPTRPHVEVGGETVPRRGPGHRKQRDPVVVSEPGAGEGLRIRLGS